MKKILTIFSLVIVVLLIIGTVSAVTATIRPDGDITAQWAKRPTSASTNYQCVDESSVSTTDYVHATSASKLDLYSLSNMDVSNIESINSVQVNYIAEISGYIFCW